MFEITPQEDKFELRKDGVYVGTFNSHEDAVKAQCVAETSEKSGTWVDDGAGIEYPKESDNYHSGEERLSGEARVDALVEWLRKFGMHVPYEIAPKG